MSSEPISAEQTVPVKTVRSGGMRSFAKMGAIFAGGNLIAALFRMLAGVLVVSFVSPKSLGLFNSVALVAAYAPVLHLGVLNGLGREIPFHTGRGDRKYVQELAAAAQAWALLVATVVGVGVMGLAVAAALQGNWLMAVLWASNAAVSFLVVGVQAYLEATFRTGGEFARLSVATVVQSALAVVFIPIIMKFDIWGLCARLVINTFIYCAMLWYWRPLRTRPRFAWNHLKHLWKIGLPIFLVGEMWRWWTLMDTTLVLRKMGTEAVGLYSLAVMVNLPFVLLIGSISQMVYPRMAECYGRTGRLNDVFRIGIKPTILLVGVMAPVMAVSWFVLPHAIRLFAPRYVGGVEAAQWCVLAQGILAFRPINNVFNVVKRQDLATMTVLAGASVYLFSLVWLGRDGYALVHFPISMLIGNAVYLLANYGLLYYLLRRGIEPTETEPATPTP